MARLFLRLCGPARELEDRLDVDVEWLFRQETGTVVAEGSGRLAELGQASPWGADAPEVIVLAPVESVLCLARAVPGRSVSQIARALPFAVEEFVTQDIETMHLAHGPVTRGEPVSCVLVDRQLLADWLAAIRSSGLAATFMTPDASLLPRDGAAVLFEGQDALLRSGPHLTRLDGGALPDALAAAAPDDAASSGEAPRLAVIGADPAQVEALRRVVPHAVAEHPIEGSVLRFLSSHFDGARDINMLQGPFAPPRRRRVAAGRWRTVAAVAAVWLVVFVGVRFGEGLWADYRADALRAEAATLYRELYPEARPPRNAYVEMRRRVGQPERAAGADFEVLLGTLAGAIDAAVQGVELQSLSFSETRGELTTELSLREYADLDRLRLQLEEQGLVVHIGSAEEQDGIVRARLRLGTG